MELEKLFFEEREKKAEEIKNIYLEMIETSNYIRSSSIREAGFALNDEFQELFVRNETDSNTEYHYIQKFAKWYFKYEEIKRGCFDASLKEAKEKLKNEFLKYPHSAEDPEQKHPYYPAKVQLHDNYTDKSTPITSTKIITSKKLIELDYAAFDFKGKWFDFLGQPAINFKEVIHGSPGSGKSNYAIQHAMNLAKNFGSVIYVSGEEGFSKTFKDKFIKNNATSESFHVADLHSYEELLKEIKIDLYHFIFIDSISTLHIDAEMLKQFCARHKNSAIIVICQETKDGKMRGSNEIIHDVDIEVIVTNGIAVTNKNRFKEIGKEFNVFENF